MTVLVKWFLFVAVTMTGLFFAEQKDALSIIVSNDKSYLALVIMSIYVVMTVYIGKLAFHADIAKKRKDKDDLLHQSDIGWFCAEHFFSLGLLGTIIGLVLATGGSLDENMPVSQIVAGLKEGLNTAFFTTICGIVFSLLLQIQLLILKCHLEHDEEK